MIRSFIRLSGSRTMASSNTIKGSVDPRLRSPFEEKKECKKSKHSVSVLRNFEKGTQTTDLDTMSMATCDDGKTEQECLKCHIVKSVSYYHKNQRTCKGCIGLYREWRKINKENIDRVKRELKQSRDEFFAKHLGMGQEPAVKDGEAK